MASGTLAPLRRCHALRRMVHVSLYPSLSPSSFATASSSPKGAQMHTSRGTERSTADSVHPTGPVGNSPRPRAPEASRTWCFTPAFSMSDLNSFFSSTSSAVEDCGTFASSASSSPALVVILHRAGEGRRVRTGAGRRRAERARDRPAAIPWTHGDAVAEAIAFGSRPRGSVDGGSVDGGGSGSPKYSEIRPRFFAFPVKPRGNGAADGACPDPVPHARARSRVRASRNPRDLVSGSNTSDRTPPASSLRTRRA